MFLLPLSIYLNFWDWFEGEVPDMVWTAICWSIPLIELTSRLKRSIMFRWFCASNWTSSRSLENTRKRTGTMKFSPPSCAAWEKAMTSVVSVHRWGSSPIVSWDRGHHTPSRSGLFRSSLVELYHGTGDSSCPLKSRYVMEHVPSGLLESYCTVRPRLKPIYIQRLRCDSRIAVTSFLNRLQSYPPATSNLVAVAVALAVANAVCNSTVHNLRNWFQSNITASSQTCRSHQM